MRSAMPMRSSRGAMTASEPNEQLSWEVVWPNRCRHMAKPLSVGKHQAKRGVSGAGARGAGASYGSGQGAVSEERPGEAGLDLGIESRAGETVPLWRSETQGAENGSRAGAAGPHLLRTRSQ